MVKFIIKDIVLATKEQLNGINTEKSVDNLNKMVNYGISIPIGTHNMISYDEINKFVFTSKKFYIKDDNIYGEISLVNNKFFALDELSDVLLKKVFDNFLIKPFINKNNIISHFNIVNIKDISEIDYSFKQGENVAKMSVILRMGMDKDFSLLNIFKKIYIQLEKINSISISDEDSHKYETDPELSELENFISIARETDAKVLAFGSIMKLDKDGFFRDVCDV